MSPSQKKESEAQTKGVRFIIVWKMVRGISLTAFVTAMNAKEPHKHRIKSGKINSLGTSLSGFYLK